MRIKEIMELRSKEQLKARELSQKQYGLVNLSEFWGSSNQAGTASLNFKGTAQRVWVELVLKKIQRVW